jgi:glycosyltransferase involved in cell wall biosynthesis
VAARLPDAPLELPTGAGFCMAIGALALQTIGGFRDDVFGRGYYEDTDWCQRAASEGFRNVQAPNLFVYHEPGSASFTEASRVKLSEQNRTEFVRRHPRYGGQARFFLRNDPHAAYRKVLRVGAWLEAAAGCGLYIQHGWGGGVSSAVEASTRSLLEAGGCVIEAVATGPDAFSLVFGYGDERVEFTGASGVRLGSLIRSAAPMSVELHAGHSLTDPPVAMAEILAAVRPEANVRLFVHDFLLVCPSQHLLDWRGRFCNVPTAGHCGTCLPRNHNASAFALSIDDWRRKWRGVLERVSELVVFDESALPILSAAYPAGLPPVRVEPHPSPGPEGKPQYRPRRTLSHLGFVGAMWRHKGSALVQSICSYMAHARPEVALTLVGEWMDGAPPPNLTVTGRYQPDELQAILDDLDIDAVVFPSVCPETFSFTLSEVFAMRIPCVGLDIGAQGTRLRAYERGAVASIEPWRMIEEVERLLERTAGHGEAPGL